MGFQSSQNITGAGWFMGFPQFELSAEWVGDRGLTHGTRRSGFSS
ncbi:MULTISPECIES: hypothetical protein [Cyanophyceae]|nr:hypothetical protein [Nodosilinea sp. FACHB-131]